VVIPLDLSGAEGMADRARCIRTKLEVAHFRLAIFGSFKKSVLQRLLPSCPQLVERKKPARGAVLWCVPVATIRPLAIDGYPQQATLIQSKWPWRISPTAVCYRQQHPSARHGAAYNQRVIVISGIKI
jgi:hypothetical protein